MDPVEIDLTPSKDGILHAWNQLVEHPPWKEMKFEEMSWKGAKGVDVYEAVSSSAYTSPLLTDLGWPKVGLEITLSQEFLSDGKATKDYLTILCEKAQIVPTDISVKPYITLVTVQIVMTGYPTLGGSLANTKHALGTWGQAPEGYEFNWSGPPGVPTSPFMTKKKATFTYGYSPDAPKRIRPELVNPTAGGATIEELIGKIDEVLDEESD